MFSLGTSLEVCQKIPTLIIEWNDSSQRGSVSLYRCPQKLIVSGIKQILTSGNRVLDSIGLWLGLEYLFAEGSWKVRGRCSTTHSIAACACKCILLHPHIQQPHTAWLASSFRCKGCLLPLVFGLGALWLTASEWLSSLCQQVESFYDWGPEFFLAQCAEIHLPVDCRKYSFTRQVAEKAFQFHGAVCYWVYRELKPHHSRERSPAFQDDILEIHPCSTLTHALCCNSGNFVYLISSTLISYFSGGYPAHVYVIIKTFMFGTPVMRWVGIVIITLANPSSLQ